MGRDSSTISHLSFFFEGFISLYLSCWGQAKKKSTIHVLCGLQTFFIFIDGNR